MKQRIWFVITMALSSALGVYVVALAMEGPPYEYLSGKISPDPAIESTRVTIHFDITPPHKYCPGTAYRELVNDEATATLVKGQNISTYDPTPTSPNIKVGETRELNKTFVLSELRGAHKIRYEARACFRCNPLQEVFTFLNCVQTPTVKFEGRSFN